MSKHKKASVQTLRRSGTPVLEKLRSERPLSRMPRWLAVLACLLLLALGAAYLVIARSRHAAPPPLATIATTPAPALPPAEQALRAALARRPNDPAAHEALGDYVLEEHRPFEALWHYRAVEDLRPDDRNPPVAIARALTQAGLPAEATALLRSTPDHPPNPQPVPRTASSALALAETALATARPVDALADLTDAGPALAASAPAALLLGDARFATGDTAGAEVAYRRAVVLEPKSAAGYDRLGRMALASHHWAAARKAFGAAREREPQNPGDLYRLGLAAMGAGDRSEAERLWHAAIAISPQYAPALVALGKQYRDHRNWRMASAYLVAAAKSDLSSEEAQLGLAEVMTAQGDRASAFYQRGFNDLETDRPHRAVAEFRRMMAAAPERVDGPLMTSMAYIQMQRLDLAATEAQHGLVRHPDDPRLLERLVQLHTISHNRPLARRVCEEWMKRDSQAAEPYVLLERIAREEERLPEARQWGERALAREPDDAAACYQMSKTLSAIPGAENQRRALDLAHQAVARNPREPDHWYQLGVLLRGAGRPEEAADALLGALDRKHDSTPACSLVVQIAAQENRPATARFFARLVTALEERRRVADALWRAVYSRPADAQAHERLAAHLLSTGDLLHARYQIEQLAQLRPADRAAAGKLAMVRRILELRDS